MSLLTRVACGSASEEDGRLIRLGSLIATAGLICLLGVGCGSDSERIPRATGKPTAPPELGRYLLQRGDLPGLVPTGSPRTDTGPPLPDLPPEGVERLRRSGYISTTFQPAEGESSGGVSSVLLFETGAGARAWMEYETSDEAIEDQIPGAKIKRFRVADVPGAHGWTGPDRHGIPIGHVYWIQGRCMILLGLETEGPRVEPLSTGAKAIYERSKGTCP